MISIHITTKGSHLYNANQRLFIKVQDEIIEHHLGYLKSIFLYPDVTISSNLIRKCNDLGISILFCRKQGHAFAMLGHPNIGKRANLVSKQLRISKTQIAKTLSSSWIKKKEVRRLEMIETYNIRSIRVQKLIAAYKQTIQSEDTNFLQAEASLSKQFYKIYNHLLPEGLKFNKRSRRPAIDFTNALLNYSYSLLYPTVEKAILKYRLDPYIGFHHGMARNEKAFLFDVIEMYRPYIENLILNQSNELLTFKSNDAFLSEQCRKFLIPTFYNMLKDGNPSIYKTLNLEIKEIAKSINLLL